MDSANRVRTVSWGCLLVGMLLVAPSVGYGEGGDSAGGETADSSETSPPASEGQDEQTKGEGDSEGSGVASEGDKGDGEPTDDGSDDQMRRKRQRAKAIAIQKAGSPGGWLRREWQWDFDLEAAYGGLDGEALWLGQVRTGVTWVAEPSAFVMGITGELGNQTAPAVGLEFESLSLHYAVYGRLGAMFDIDGRPILSAGAGIQIFGTELQYRDRPGPGGVWLGLMELRLPVSWLVEGLVGRDAG